MIHRIALIFLAIFFSTPAFAINLTAHDKSEYQIILRPGATEPEKTAARELHDYIDRITGFIQIPIVTQDQTDPKLHAILIGPSERVKQLCPDVKWNDLGHDGIVIRTVGDDLILAGGQPRGTLYAVYTFLEDTLGVRWWTSTEEFVPQRKDISIGNLNTVYVPKLKYREAFYHDVIGANYIQAARLKLNGHMTDIPASWGGHYKILGWCHTFYQLLPPAKYFAAHPEWYSLINGKRTADGAQLCLTNDAMREELVKNALAEIKKDPDAGIISIAQNDCFNPCQCDKCQAIAKQEGSESGPIIHFVNQVAAEIKKQYPDYLVETLAYNYSRHPPAHIHPADNVLVRLCSIECDFAHPLDSPANADFANDMKGWSAIAPNLFVWNYVTNFASYFQPHPNMNSLDVDLRWFVDNHVIGVFEQGDAYNDKAGDFLPLRAWLMAHLLWNPDADQRKLRDEFLDGYYGPAGKYLGEYLDLINNNATDSKSFRLRCNNGDLSFLDAQTLAKAESLFAQAEQAVANDPPRALRLRREHLPLELVAIQRFDFAGKAKAAEAAGKDRVQTVCQEYGAMLDHYATVAEACGANDWAEGYPFAAGVELTRSECAMAIPPQLPAVGAALPPGEFDVQQDRFRLFRPGEWAEIVNDPKASDGKAARMPGTHTQWAIQFPISKDQMPTGPGPWRCYIVARVDANAKGGGALQYGLLSEPSHSLAAQGVAPIEKFADGDYVPLGISVNDLSPGSYFWIAPLGNNDVKNIYVDRIFFVKDKKN